MSDLWIIYCVVFAAVILAVQALYWLIVGAQRRGATLKRRLALSAGRAASEPVDILRQERGLANLDHPRFASLNEFLAQTGVRISLLALCLWTASLGAMVALALFPFLSALGRRGGRFGGRPAGCRRLLVDRPPKADRSLHRPTA